MRILIVDDEKNIRLTMSTALEAMKHEAATATNGALALHALKTDAFDVVLLDLRLGSESGLELVEEILRVSPRIAVILMTAYASLDTAVEAMRRGAFDYLPKPCTPEQLRQVLAALKERGSSKTALPNSNRARRPMRRNMNCKAHRRECRSPSTSPSKPRIAKPRF